MQRRLKAPCPADVALAWAPLPSLILFLEGSQPPSALQRPAGIRLAPHRLTSITLKQAAAYAYWLEQAFACIARGHSASTVILCMDFEVSLGPAAAWLKAIGAVFDDDSLVVGKR